MTGILLPAGGLIAAIAGLAVYWYQAATREFILQRLSEADTDTRPVVDAEWPFANRHYFLPWLVVVPIGLILVQLWGWPWNIVLGLVIVAGFIGTEIDAWIYGWRLSRMESQLADAIDVLVASVSSGASLQASLRQASEFTPMPLRGELSEMVARLRLGDSPPDVFDLLATARAHGNVSSVRDDSDRQLDGWRRIGGNTGGYRKHDSRPTGDCPTDSHTQHAGYVDDSDRIGRGVVHGSHDVAIRSAAVRGVSSERSRIVVSRRELVLARRRCRAGLAYQSSEDLGGDSDGACVLDSSSRNCAGDRPVDLASRV